MLTMNTIASGESPPGVNNLTATAKLMASPSFEKIENGAPWLGSPIQRSTEAESEYFDCDTDLSGLGICLKQLKLQPSAPANADDTFVIEDEEFVDPDAEIDGDFSLVLNAALQAQELEFREKIQEKDELIKNLKEGVEQQKLKSRGSSSKVNEYEEKILDRYNELAELTNKLDLTLKEKNQIKHDVKELLQDVNACEESFSMLHRNYEKVKVILENFNKNEQLFESRYEHMRRIGEMRGKKLEAIKKQAEEKISMAKRDYEEKLREAEAEQTKLKAMICMNEVQIRQLEAGVTQKTREVNQLRELCQELIKGKNC